MGKIHSIFVDFDLSLVAGDAQVSRYLSLCLQPILQSLDRSPSSLTVLFSPRLLDLTATGAEQFRWIEDFITRIAKTGRLLLPESLRYRPSQLSAFGFKLQRNAYREFWHAHQVETSSQFIFPRFTAPAGAETFAHGAVSPDPSVSVVFGDDFREQAVQQVVKWLDSDEPPQFAAARIPELSRWDNWATIDTARRTTELEAEAEKLAPRVEHLADNNWLKERHHRGLSFIAASAHREASSLSIQQLLELRQFHAEAITRAQVELDSVAHPEVDPNVGWVHWEGEQEHIDYVDTQLMRLVFDRSQSGGITHFEYKPQKINLSAPLARSGVADLVPSFGLSLAEIPQDASGLAALVPAKNAGPVRALITKQTPGLVSIRYSGKEGQAELSREFTFKAGIGAYLNNATTGFSLEYWVEADKPAGAAIIECHFLPPSLHAAELELKPLLCVGGVEKVPVSADKPVLLKHNDVPGGAYGIRFIDRRQKLLMDLRSAKQLSALGILPLSGPNDGKSPIGWSIFFFVDAARINNSDRANTLFLSIE